MSEKNKAASIVIIMRQPNLLNSTIRHYVITTAASSEVMAP